MEKKTSLILMVTLLLSVFSISQAESSYTWHYRIRGGYSAGTSEKNVTLPFIGPKNFTWMINITFNDYNSSSSFSMEIWNATTPYKYYALNGEYLDADSMNFSGNDGSTADVTLDSGDMLINGTYATLTTTYDLTYPAGLVANSEDTGTMAELLVFDFDTDTTVDIWVSTNDPLVGFEIMSYFPYLIMSLIPILILLKVIDKLIKR